MKAAATSDLFARGPRIGELRAISELLSLPGSLPLLLSAPRGDRQPVLVLPGLSASDFSTRPMRRYLRWLGYRAEPWRQGRNRGPVPGLEKALIERLEAIADRHQRRVSLIGWSLGGAFARRLAQLRPKRVRQVITLGSPIAGEVSADRLPVPTTAIYSRSDAIVPWRLAREKAAPLSENIEIEGSHLGLGVNPVVLLAIADRLAQPAGAWRPFRPKGIRKLFYPRPDRD